MKIPESVLSEFKQQVANVNFGRVTIECVLHDGLPRWRIVREVSIIPCRQSSGAVHGEAADA